MQELSNLVVEELLPGESRPGDAILKVARSLLHQQPCHSLHCVQWLSSWKCQSFILETLFLDVLAGSEGSLGEGAFEGVPGPLEGVLNGIWEILEGAYGDALLWWGFYFMALAAAPGGYWTFYGPLVMHLLLRYVSGVALLERKQSKHPEFAAYAKETNAFIPWCPKASDDDYKQIN